jgi:hypothetical protein
MGTWGTGPFDDDVAADWAGDLVLSGVEGEHLRVGLRR